MNQCEGCPRSCCLNFKITSEIRDPFGLQKELNLFPFIRRTGEELILDPQGHECVVGVYNCDRFDTDKGECRDYGIKPRPIFCETTGIRTSPHGQCLLKSRDGDKKVA